MGAIVVARLGLSSHHALWRNSQGIESASKTRQESAVVERSQRDWLTWRDLKW